MLFPTAPSYTFRRVLILDGQLINFQIFLRILWFLPLKKMRECALNILISKELRTIHDLVVKTKKSVVFIACSRR